MRKQIMNPRKKHYRISENYLCMRCDITPEKCNKNLKEINCINCLRKLKKGIFDEELQKKVKLS